MRHYPYCVRVLLKHCLATNSKCVCLLCLLHHDVVARHVAEWRTWQSTDEISLWLCWASSSDIQDAEDTMGTKRVATGDKQMDRGVHAMDNHWSPIIIKIKELENNSTDHQTYHKGWNIQQFSDKFQRWQVAGRIAVHPAEWKTRTVLVPCNEAQHLFHKQAMFHCSENENIAILLSAGQCWCLRLDFH